MKLKSPYNSSVLITNVVVKELIVCLTKKTKDLVNPGKGGSLLISDGVFQCIVLSGSGHSFQWKIVHCMRNRHWKKEMPMVKVMYSTHLIIMITPLSGKSFPVQTSIMPEETKVIKKKC